MDDLQKILKFMKFSSSNFHIFNGDYREGLEDSFAEIKEYIAVLQMEKELKTPCKDCRWQGKRHQKCNCCKRNKNLADLYERK